MTGSQATSSLLPRTSGATGGVGGGTGLESLELESATADDIIQNVEKMLAQEQARNEQLKGDKAANSKQLDLTGLSAGAGGKGADSSAAAGGRRGTTAGGPGGEAGSSTLTGASEGSTAQPGKDGELGEGVLDQGMALIRRKTLAIKSDNVSDVVMSNLGAISESVAQFQKMTEEAQEDGALNYQNLKENYEKQIEKLQARVEKQTQRRDELQGLVTTLGGEVEQLEYERGQY